MLTLCTATPRALLVTLMQFNGEGMFDHPLFIFRIVTLLPVPSVQFISMYPGDPTTPGYPSYENSTRTEGENIPSIPSLPISWANAEVPQVSLSSKIRI